MKQPSPPRIEPDETTQRRLGHGHDGPPVLTIPPAVIGVLLLLAVVLAVIFYVAAQTVHTP